MTIGEALEKVVYVSFTGEMNATFHQIRWTELADWDQGFKIAIALLTGVSAVLSVASFRQDSSRWWSVFSCATSVLGLLVALWLFAAPPERRLNHHQDLLKKWGDLWSDAVAYETTLSQTGSPESMCPSACAAAVDALEKRRMDLNLRERRDAEDDALYQQCEDTVNIRRTGYATQDEYDDAMRKKDEEDAKAKAGDDGPRAF